MPHDCKIHLIGHSIGAWIILELLKDPEIQQKVQHTYLLFPTIERMAVSKNGRTFTKFIQPLWFLFRYIFVIFSALPLIIRTIIMSVIFFILSFPQHFIGTAIKYGQISIMEKVVHLAGEEMEQVVNLDVQTIEKNKHLIKFYYGSNDEWVPIIYMHQLCDTISNVDAELDGSNINHAFVLKHSETMGRKVGEWILEYGRENSY